jgi:hypothetical protein
MCLVCLSQKKAFFSGCSNRLLVYIMNLEETLARKSNHMQFMADKSPLEHVLLRVFRLSNLSIIRGVFCTNLLLNSDVTRTSWQNLTDLQNTAVLSDIRKVLEMKVMSRFCQYLMS